MTDELAIVFAMYPMTCWGLAHLHGCGMYVVLSGMVRYRALGPQGGCAGSSSTTQREEPSLRQGRKVCRFVTQEGRVDVLDET